MTLGYIGAKDRQNAGWRTILSFLHTKKVATPKEVALEFGLGHEVEVIDQGKRRIRHTGPSEANLRLKRLAAWGMATRYRKEGLLVYEITDYGKEVSDNPTSGGEKAPSVGSLEKGPRGRLIKGPVALMRVQEVRSADQVTRRLPEEVIAVEKKFDGWLTQVPGGRIYSRRGIELTENFPPIAQAIRGWSEEHVLGELVYWTPDGKMDETMVAHVANVEDPRKAVQRLKDAPGTYQLIVFDILARGGEDITDRPFSKRRAILEKFIRPGGHVSISPIYPFKAWKLAFAEALKEGGEGVLFKNLDASYIYRELGEREPSPANTQWKLKEKLTDDFIVFNLSISEKERLKLHFGQFWNGRLVKVGEVNNLSADTEKEMAKRMLAGPFVVELEFQSRFSGHPGALRNPVFKRFRDDKPMESVQLPKEHVE